MYAARWLIVCWVFVVCFLFSSVEVDCCWILFSFLFWSGHCNHFLVARCPWFLLFLTKLFLCFFILFLFAPSRPWSLPVVKTASEEVLRSRRGSSQSSDGSCSFSLGADRGRPSHRGRSESPEIVRVVGGCPESFVGDRTGKLACQCLAGWLLLFLVSINFLTFCFIFNRVSPGRRRCSESPEIIDGSCSFSLPGVSRRSLRITGELARQCLAGWLLLFLVSIIF